MPNLERLTELQGKSSLSKAWFLNDSAPFVRASRPLGESRLALVPTAGRIATAVALGLTMAAPHGAPSSNGLPRGAPRPVVRIINGAFMLVRVSFLCHAGS